MLFFIPLDEGNLDFISIANVLVYFRCLKFEDYTKNSASKKIRNWLENSWSVGHTFIKEKTVVQKTVKAAPISQSHLRMFTSCGPQLESELHSGLRSHITCWCGCTGFHQDHSILGEFRATDTWFREQGAGWTRELVWPKPRNESMGYCEEEEVRH